MNVNPENLPATVTLKDIAKARMDEINMLSLAIREPPAKGQLFQRLPKHMRRRQMSHFQSRLPRRLRSFISKTERKDPSKRPNRKYRRKPSNLRQEYERRKRSVTWLETHIWHAKRFHMIERWNYKLADKPTNKSFRANYRATSQHCLIIDISYYNCIELVGEEMNILAGIQQCVNSACGLTFAAKLYIDGLREGYATVFHPNSYPKRAIGTVKFIWKYRSNESDRVLWLWIHPACHDELVQCLKNLFRENVQVNLLKDKLNRFKLIGPLSQAIMADVFRTPDIVHEVSEPPHKKIKKEVADEDLVAEVVNVTTPLHEFYKDNSLAYAAQKRFYKTQENYSSPSQLPSHMIFSLLVTDPRLTIPEKRTKSTFKGAIGTNQPVQLNEKLICSAIWNENLREISLKNKLSTWKINELRGSFISGVPETLNVEELTGKVPSAIPILIIHQPGSNKRGSLGYGSGWDIILPNNWSRPFWQSFILHGARPGGLSDFTSHQLELSTLRDTLQIDSAAGLGEFANINELYRAQHFRLPPNKRPNYLKLGVGSPFLPQWALLTEQWDRTRDFYIVRDKKILEDLSKSLSNEVQGGGLVAVSVVCSEGKPSAFATISLPNKEDVLGFYKKNPGPLEPTHVDPYEKQRAILRANHQQFLKTERKKRKRNSRKLKMEINNQPLGVMLPEKCIVERGKKLVLRACEEASNEFNETMEKLWLPEEPTIIETTRRTAGFLIKGDFSFGRAKGAGLGYISHTSLLELFRFSSDNKVKPFLLIRNNNEAQYRFCSFHIVME